MVANIALQVLNENHWTIDDITVVNAEFLIDNASDFINLMAGTSIANIAASALTATDSELLVTKELASLMIRAFLDRGPNVSIGGLTVSSVLSDPQYATKADMIQKGIAALTVQHTASHGIAFSVGTDDSDLVDVI